MNEDLNDLRRIAEVATDGPWRAADDADGFTFVDRGPGQLATIAEVVPSNLNRGNDADFIATFNPETTLALLSRLEQAEQAVARVREVATAMANHNLPESPRGGAWETAHGAQLFAKDILETLDGDGRG